MIGGRGRTGPARGADLRYNMEISLEEAFHGKIASLACRHRWPAKFAPDPARGRAKARHCPTCGGQGRVRAQQGFFAIERTCPIARDAAKSSTIHAPCAGTGRVTRERSLSVNIPAGVEDGTRIRLRRGRGRKRGGRRAISIFSLDQAASIFSARRRRSLLPCPDLDGAGGARRRGQVHTLDGAAAKVNPGRRAIGSNSS